ncbi:MAG: twin-arginine translocation signal domain-containing protein [Micromonosporaceae bacterium]|nr:twin-arginine translocation signal domain-containing protein [Micromonosporaceae bacterium]
MKEDRRSPLSRRRFLGGVGATAAGAVAAGAVPAITGGDPAAAATPSNRFGRIFPSLPPFFNQVDDRLLAALRDMGKPGGLLDAKDNLAAGPVQLIADPSLSLNNPDNQTHTAGTHFFGQFLDHDMTFDTSSKLGVPTAPETSPNGRTPAFDLDSVYGGGPVASPTLYESDHVKLRIESGGLFEDLPRMPDGTAIIAEPRNDENAMIAGLQCALILFHNQVVDMLRSQGVLPSQQFAMARRLVTWHYQWIIVHEFLPLFIGAPLVQNILTSGRQWYRPEPGPAYIPVEFQGAAYRFGHSMVRPSYRLNLHGNPDGSAFFGFIFDPSQEGVADPNDLRGGHRAPRRFVGWQTFFDFGGSFSTDLRRNKRIDTKISTPLFNIPLATIPSADPPTALAQRNLLRQVTWSIPAGQRIAQTMGNPMLHLQELADYGIALENQTPLWYYVLAEAEQLAGGLTLGPTGGRIVGEVFIGLLQLDPNSYLRAAPAGWVPTLPAKVPGTFTIVDLLTFAKVDPTSRGQ